MTIAPETQIVSSAFDQQAKMYCYTGRRGQQRWTVRIDKETLDALPIAQRRAYVVQAITNAMRGPADGG